MNILEAKKMMIKHYGEGAVMIPSDSEIFDRCICSTGLLGLDKALGTTGIPRDRIIEIYGPEASGKTTLALTLARAVQEADGDVTFVDVENALDTNYARDGLGVDVENMLISQPDYGEQAIDIVVNLLDMQRAEPSRPHLFIIDSVDALVPKQELDCDFDVERDEKGKKVEKSGGGLGLRARLMSGACRRLTAKIKDSNATIIFINQIRSKIGVMYGNPETTSGGNALKFYASLRLDIRHSGQFKAGEEVIGNNFKIKVVKNKCAPPFKVYEGLNLHGKGFQKDYDLFSVLEKTQMISRKGSWMEINGLDKKFQGFAGFCELMKDEGNLLHCESLVQ